MLKNKSIYAYLPRYRSDIDGLRGIAVLSVIFYHLFPFGSRGFIGVDIFFVISGFLISSIIKKDLELGTFSFGSFFARRIRRIFPALILVIFSSLIFGWLLLKPEFFSKLGIDIVAGASFASNFIYWHEALDYFNASFDKPLLHLWSLGIEEQFYIVYPIFLYVVWKSKFNTLFLITIIIVVSFIFNITKGGTDPIQVFYSPFSRLWELLLGSTLVFAKRSSSQNSLVSLRNYQSLLGGGLIIISFFFIKKDIAFSGYEILLPTLGALFLISAGERAYFNRIVLSHPVIVWFGLISYPLYLWHLPLLSFISEGSIFPTRENKVTVLCISIILAYLTYIIVEKPIRSGKYNKIKTIGLLLCMFVIGLAGMLVHKMEGFKNRPLKNFQEYDGDISNEKYYEYLYKNFYSCPPALDVTINDVWKPIDKEKPAINNRSRGRCMQSHDNEPAKIIIIGDSHAENIFIGLAEKLANKNIISFFIDSLPYYNNKKTEELFNYIISNKNINIVILSSYWNHKKSNAENEGIDFKNELFFTVKKLTEANKLVYIVDDIPNFPFFVTHCKYARFSFSKRVCDSEISYYESQHSYYPSLQYIEKSFSHVKILQTKQYFCTQSTCSMLIDDKLLYRDYDHLNILGSKYLGNRLLDDNPEIAQ